MNAGIFGPSKTDLMFKTTIRKIRAKTKVVTFNGHEGEFMGGISMTIDPNQELQEKLEISAWDEDTIMDEKIGSILPLQTKDLIALGQKEGGSFFWKEIFGAPKGF